MFLDSSEYNTDPNKWAQQDKSGNEWYVHRYHRDYERQNPIRAQIIQQARENFLNTQDVKLPCGGNIVRTEHPLRPIALMARELNRLKAEEAKQATLEESEKVIWLRFIAFCVFLVLFCVIFQMF